MRFLHQERCAYGCYADKSALFCKLYMLRTGDIAPALDTHYLNNQAPAPASGGAAARVGRAQVSPGLQAHMASLQSHWQRLPLQQLLPLAAAALLTAACQRSSADLGSGLAADGAAVAVAMCQMAVNGVAVVPPRVSSPADRRGQALYPLLSLLNHSCRPNVSVTFEVHS